MPEFDYILRVETPNQAAQEFDISRSTLTIGGTDSADLSLADPNLPPEALELSYEGGVLMARGVTSTIVPVYCDSPRVGAFIVEASRPVVLGRHTIRWSQSAQSIAAAADRHAASTAEHTIRTPPSVPQLTDEEFRRAVLGIGRAAHEEPASASSAVANILGLTIGFGILAGVFFVLRGNPGFQDSSTPSFRGHPNSQGSSTPSCSQACRDPRSAGHEFARAFANTAGREAFTECIDNLAITAARTGRYGDSDSCEQAARNACTRACERAR